MKVTAQWIADQCGVSRGTVDRVVNGRPNVSPEVRERIQKLISEYGYKTPTQRQAARAGTASASSCRAGMRSSFAACATASALRCTTAA